MKHSEIKKDMKVIGADGVHVGTVDRIAGDRIKLAKQDSGLGRHKGHHHYIDLSLVAEIEGNTVRLSANATTAVTFEEEASGQPTSD
jgi:hypothetical protein